MKSLAKSRMSQQAVMFADIAGSTRLFEEAGDLAAKSAIERYFVLMTEIIEQHHGKVIQVIGDEVMSAFAQCDEAVAASCSIMEKVEYVSSTEKYPLKVRIGINYGPVFQDQYRAFGDVVNVAARMAAIAQQKQIIVTGSVTTVLSRNAGFAYRPFDHVRVKGKKDAMNVYEILWEHSDQTLQKNRPYKNPGQSSKLKLVYRDRVVMLDKKISGFELGRDSVGGLYINSPFASRAHAVIDIQREQFVIEDKSLNGTYVNPDDGHVVYLRREKLPLVTSGIISLGTPVESNRSHHIRYSRQPE